MHRISIRQPTPTFLAVAAVFAVSLVCPLSLRADEFLLRSGGRIEGEWLNREEQPLTAYRVRTRAGVVLHLNTSDVSEAIRLSPERAEYDRLAPTSADTVEGNWSLAEWCRKQGLTSERQNHLRRIIELDENHQAARRALGYTFIEGKWITQEDFRREEGYEYYKGRWRTAQEIEILESRSKYNLAQREWLARLKRYRLNMNDAGKARAAIEAVRAIDDPVAVRPLAELLASERVRSVKFLYVDVLASINTADAVHVLVHRSLQDPDEEMFYYCVDRLAGIKQPGVTEAYVAALKDSSNERVNKAAAALARMNDRSAISPLIDALVTSHASVKPSKFGGDATAVSFNGNGSSMMQNEGPKVQIAHVRNQHVLDTLTKLSGGSNFGFDQRAWRYWYAQEKKAEQAGQTLGRRSVN